MADAHYARAAAACRSQAPRSAAMLAALAFQLEYFLAADALRPSFVATRRRGWLAAVRTPGGPDVAGAVVCADELVAALVVSRGSAEYEVTGA